MVENDESSNVSIQQRKDGEDDEEEDYSEIEDEKEMDKQRRVQIQKQKQEKRRHREMEEQEQQVLKISTERFTAPEVLFFIFTVLRRPTPTMWYSGCHISVDESMSC